MCKKAHLQRNLLPIDGELGYNVKCFNTFRDSGPKDQGKQEAKKERTRIGSLARWDTERTGRHRRFLQSRRQIQAFLHQPSITFEACDCWLSTGELNGSEFLSGVICTGRWASFHGEHSTGHSLRSAWVHFWTLLPCWPQQHPTPSSTQVGLLTPQAHRCPEVWHVLIPLHSYHPNSPYLSLQNRVSKI